MGLAGILVPRHLEQTIGYMENSGNILIFSDIYDTRSGRGCNVTLLTEDSQSLRDLADRAGIWTELEERHPGLTPGRILQGDHAVFGRIVIHDNLRTHGEFGLEFAGAAEAAVYAKLPRGFQIPTPVGNYAPDWAVAFRDDSGLKHLFFVAETRAPWSRSTCVESRTARLPARSACSTTWTSPTEPATSRRQPTRPYSTR